MAIFKRVCIFITMYYVVAYTILNMSTGCTERTRKPKRQSSVSWPEHFQEGIRLWRYGMLVYMLWDVA